MAGLLAGALNSMRHRRRGYVDPRPFPADDIDRTVVHAIEIVNRLTERGRIEWADMSVLEIGPGSDLTTGAVILGKGAASYMAVDLFDNRWQMHPDTYRRLGRSLGVEVDEDRLGFLRTDFPELPGLTGSYDLIVSNACLEHVERVGDLFSRLRELSGPDTRMVHHVDAKAHMRWFRDHDPLNLLRYSDAVHERLLDFPGAPNRLRATDYVRASEASGWRAEVVPGRQASPSYLDRISLAPRFRECTDLGLLSFTLICRVASP